MSDIERLIEKSKKNPKYLSYWLESLIDEEISDVRLLLKQVMVWEKHPHIIEDIRQVLKDFHKPTHWFKRFFYSIFGIEKKGDSQKRLNILLEQLNTDSYKIESEYKSVKVNRQKVSKVLENLQILRIEFERDKNSAFFLNEIDDKITLLQIYNITLLLRENNLLDIQTLYNNINNIKIKG